MRWGILFGVLVMLAGCAGKSGSDEDDAGGSGNAAGKGGSDGNGKGGSGATSSGGSTGGFGAGATGGTSSNGGTGTGGTIGAAGEPGGGSGGSAGTGVDPSCTDLTTAAVPSVQIAFSADGTPPSPAGGAVQAGTYYLAEETFYGASEECQSLGASYDDFSIELVEVVRFVPQTATSGNLEIALEVTSSAGVDPTRATGAGTYSTSGSIMTVSGTCGATTDGSSEPADYTMAGEELVLFSHANTSCDVTVAVYRKL